MKKVFVIAAALFVVNQAFSQVKIDTRVSSDSHVKIGLKAGVNMAWVSDVPTKIYENSGMVAGFYAGAVCNIKFSYFLSLQPELLFSKQGGQILNPNGYIIANPPVTDIGEAMVATFNYVYLPVLLEAKPSKLTPKFGFLAGAQIGYNISRSFVIDGKTYSDNEIVERSSKLRYDKGSYPFNKFDAGVIVGIQYSFTEKISASTRVSIGLIDTFSANNTYYGMKNFALQVGINYLFLDYKSKYRCKSCY